MKPLNYPAQRAVVIGSSMAGLLAARACADHFKEVLLVEQDTIDQTGSHRKGVPQDHHVHILLTRGYRALEAYFPEVIPQLKERGAIAGDLGQLLKWHCEGGYRPRCLTGMQTMMLSRPLLEHTVREALLSYDNVQLMAGTKCQGFLREGNSVIGIATNKGNLQAELTIDTRGMASKLSAELEDMGYSRPVEEKVRVNVKYTSCLFPRPEGYTTFLNINTSAPLNSKHGTIQPIENGRMILTVQGRSNDEAPRDTTSLKEYTRALENLEIYEMVKDLTPLSDVRSYHIPYVRWIHYERMKEFPEGLLPLGDAVCRLNPVYGQGMSSAAIQAQVLEEVLQKKGHQSIWKTYFRRVAGAVKTPWELTVTEDFKFPETQGVPPKMPSFLLKYFNKLNRVVNQDEVIYRSFAKVLNMMSEPTILLRPSIVWRVLRAR